MKYYTSTISESLAEKLKDAGMLIEEKNCNLVCPTIAECLDFLIEKNVHITVQLSVVEDGMYDAVIHKKRRVITNARSSFWQSAIEGAIEKSLIVLW